MGRIRWSDVAEAHYKWHPNRLSTSSWWDLFFFLGGASTKQHNQLTAIINTANTNPISTFISSRANRTPPHTHTHICFSTSSFHLSWVVLVDCGNDVLGWVFIGERINPISKFVCFHLHWCTAITERRRNIKISGFAILKVETLVNYIRDWFNILIEVKLVWKCWLWTAQNARSEET